MYQVVFLLLFLPFVVSAEVSITEIMYDLEGSDSKREWIKVCGDEDLTGWKFNDGSNHNLKEERGSLILSDCAILASDATTYINEHSSYSGTVIDTVMSLNNTSDALSLINPEGGVEFSVTYNSEEGDGGFIQYLNTNVSVSEVVPNGGGPVFQEEMLITAFAGGNRTVSVGADVVFEGRAYGELNEPLLGARYMWNFGNGRTSEGESVLHHYDYPGEYVVFLTVSNIDVTKYSATDRIVVTALPADISITTAVSEYITLTNSGNRELDLSLWILRSGLSKFTLPENTVVLSQTDLILSYTVTELGVPNQYDVELLYPNGLPAFRYLPEVQSVISPEPFIIKPVVIKKIVTEEFVEENIESEQPAAVVLAKKEEGNSSWFFALIGVIIIGIVSAIVVRRKI